MAIPERMVDVSNTYMIRRSLISGNGRDRNQCISHLDARRCYAECEVVYRIQAVGRAEVPRKLCMRHGKDYPCSCGMGNLYRFIEPVVLHLLRIKGRSCGYDLGSDLRAHALTDAEIDKAALYRTLRQLEANGNVKSAWETGEGGPARRVYWLTKKGEEHLEEWTLVLEHLAKSMGGFVRDARRSLKKPVSAKARAA